MRLSERIHPVALTESADVTTSGVDSQAVNVGKANAVMFLLNFGSIAADDTLKVYVGAATATKTTAIAFNYRLAGADTKSAGSDALGTSTAVASTGLTLTAATYDHKLLVVEIDPQQIADTTPWVILEIAGSATTQNVSIVAVVEPRYASTGGTPTII